MNTVANHSPGRSLVNAIRSNIYLRSRLNCSTTTINVDSDSTSTSSHTSSEHDPQVASSASTNPTQAYHVSPTTNWPEERTSFFSANNLAPSQSNTSKPLSPPMNTPVSTLHYSSPNAASSHPLPDSTHHASATTNHHHNNDNHHHHHHTVKAIDQVPEYKLFSSNTPSLRTILFGNNENHQSNSALSHRPLLNDADHDVRVIEKRLMGMNATKIVLRLTTRFDCLPSRE